MWKWRLLSIAIVLLTVSVSAQTIAPIQNASGMRLLVPGENSQPTLRVILPGRPDTDRMIEIIFPEHVTAKRAGNSVVEHLYMFRTGRAGDRPAWRQTANSLEYERELSGEIRFLARATLEDDGIRVHYEFVNRSSISYEMIYAVTDPRLTGIFHDVRLERTYVHHSNGFDLLASETPSRMTMPLNQWLPNRYLAPFTWPVPALRVERREDGITYYNKSRAVDEPTIATLSTDHKWVIASFARTAGNVWSNPELTCQHVDPQTSLPGHARVVLEIKLLIVPASLDEVLQKVIAQRATLQ